MNLEKELQIAIIASIEAGEAIMKIYESDDFGVETKGDDSPLTKADKSANDVINNYLIKTTHEIISEENKLASYETRKNWDTAWIVDPLDGTKEFIKRNGEFTVNIALVKKGKPLLGVIYVPVTKELYFADVFEQTAFKVIATSENDYNDIKSRAVKIQPKEDASKIRIVGSRSHMNEETKQFIDGIESSKEIEIVSKGSSLKFCLIAEGKADIYPRFAPTMEWDTAAGQAICEAAGVKVISEVTKKELLYNKENLLNPWFICK